MITRYGLFGFSSAPRSVEPPVWTMVVECHASCFLGGGGGWADSRFVLVVVGDTWQGTCIMRAHVKEEQYSIF